MVLLLVAALVGIGVVVALKLNRPTEAAPVHDLEGYDFLLKAAQATNELPALQSTIQIGTEATLTSRNNTMDITGVLDLNRQSGKANLLLNTVGTSEMDSTQDFEVTTQLFSDGQKVYERSGVQTTESSIPLAEFQEACDGYQIELFAPELVRTHNVSIAPDEAGTSTLVYYLTALPEPILASVVSQYETLLEQTIVAEDIQVTKAQFAYVVQGGLVTSQNIRIATTYQADLQQSAYQSVSQISLTQSGQGYDFSLPPLPPSTEQ
ncbi:MAG: hypothetical protein LBH68_05020 [Bifidobacteriaceae bacterium]|jgi:hypothetical protein|nr:hypothetical protein [Bifidobacteriaceae bacterium]